MQTLCIFYPFFMLKTNEDHLVMLAVQGQTVHADEFLPFEVGHDGVPRALPGTGSITYNVQVGDPAYGWKTDHTEPGVSSTCTNNEKPYSKGYNFLSCAGNEVKVISGDAKGDHGTVVGKHGGVEHLILDFPQKTLEKLTLDDKFLIKAVGQGLELSDYPEILCYNLSPKLLYKMNIQEERGHGPSAKRGRNLALPVPSEAEPKISAGSLKIGVTHIVPAKVMGSGLGSLSCTRGDYDVTSQDPEAIKEYKLDTLRLGDIIAIQDADNSYGRCYKKGAISICIVIHSNSFVAGHGPGVMTLLTCPKPGKIKPFIDAKANVAQILKIGRFLGKGIRD